MSAASVIYIKIFNRNIEKKSQLKISDNSFSLNLKETRHLTSRFLKFDWYNSRNVICPKKLFMRCSSFQFKGLQNTPVSRIPN